MTKETENLYKPLLDYDLAKEENTRANELKRALVLFETDSGQIVTWDKMTQQLNTIKEVVSEAKRRLGDKPLTKEEKLKLASILKAIASELEKPE